MVRDQLWGISAHRKVITFSKKLQNVVHSIRKKEESRKNSRALSQCLALQADPLGAGAMEQGNRPSSTSQVDAETNRNRFL